MHWRRRWRAAGIIVLSIYDKTSEGLISIASACVGGLVGIFAQRAASGAK